MSYYNQGQPPVGAPPPQGYPPEGYPKDAYPPPGYPPQQGYPPQYAPQYGAPPPQQQQQQQSAGFMEGWIQKFGCPVLLLPVGCLLLSEVLMDTGYQDLIWAIKTPDLNIPLSFGQTNLRLVLVFGYLLD
ncbi:hypothetical protein L1987_74383 [Smallanthus sonchifolius]|uniref:Uncharacterized protein n=1 Tax=Smallanthus sonchifolius TaxID=185202 RepID=A0ACB9A2X4_9ASTR|nr:hypothetical protein L1987_74383 [Smallanthus sonchifolius]